MVFAADKISKVRELRAVAKVPGRRLTHYRRCVELLEHLLSDNPLVFQLRAEFDRLAVRLRAGDHRVGEGVDAGEPRAQLVG